MTKAVQKIQINPSCDIAFDKLVLSQANVRRTKTGLSIEDLAKDIARRGLLQSLHVRPVRDGEGAPTGHVALCALKTRAGRAMQATGIAPLRPRAHARVRQTSRSKARRQMTSMRML